MAMTKAERERMAHLESEARIYRALSWSNAVPAPMIPPPSTGYTSGWTWNVYTADVSQSWSGSVTHGSGEKPSRHIATQRGIALCPTRLDALLRLRSCVERQCAVKLAGIDAQIESERMGQQEPST